MEHNPYADKFPELRFGEKPSLGNVYGFGTSLIGQRDYDAETGTYVATQVFTFLFIPILALGAYRVANAPGGGWYCIGRVPLSGFARKWNVLFMLAVLLGGAGLWWNHHTKSPEYVAGQKLQEADKAAAAGQGGQAAKLCREVMDSKTSKVETAKQKLAGYIDEPPGSPSEAVGVYTVAVDLHRENRSPVPDVFGKGMALANRYAADDAAVALALLEVIAPLAPDPEAELSLRRELLEKLHAKNPDDVETAGRLAVACEAKGDRERCEKLLTPFEKRLGSTEGAAVLGRIFAARGEYDRAYALLRPYVNEKLSAYRAAEQALRGRIEAVEKRVMDSLKARNAPGFDFNRVERLPKAQQTTAVNEYYDEQLKNDPEVRSAQKRLMAERAVVGAALDLGLVQLQRGQAMTDPAARKAELEAAEKTFLSIRGSAGESDQYRLMLGQVYYWLGRAAEGKKLFDELLTARGGGTETVLMVANTLREVGDVTESRRLVEDAFAKATDPAKKQDVARFRALVFKDLDDEILWLGRSNTEQPNTKASLAHARGQKAHQDGKDNEAADQFRQAIDIYEKLPVNVSSLNNAALSHFSLFSITHEKAEFTRGMDKLDRAIALQPTDSILLSNGATTVLRGAIIDVVADAIDFRILKTSAGADTLPYLYHGAAERAVLYGRFAKHPGVVKSRTYSDKLLTLAPKRTEAYHMLASDYDWARDTAALKGLLTRLEKAELDLGDEARFLRDYIAGKEDAKNVEDARKSLSRTEAALTAARTRKDRTFAVAVGRYVQAHQAAWNVGGSPPTDELVRLAEEAHAAAPSDGTESTLQSALLLRAHTTLIRTRPEYAKLAERTKRSFGTMLVHHVVFNGGPLKDAATANPDVRRLVELALDDFKLDPDGTGVGSLILIQAVQPAAADPVAEKVRANERLRVRSRIYRILSPYSAGRVMDEYWYLRLDGKDDEAKKLLTDLAAKGIPIP